MVRVGAYIQIRNERLNFILENPNLKEVERPVFSSIQEQLGCIVTDAIVAYAVLDNTEKLDPRMDQLKRNFNDRLKKLLPKSENTDYVWGGYHRKSSEKRSVTQRKIQEPQNSESPVGVQQELGV